MAYYYTDAGLIGTDPAAFTPGSITGAYMNGTAYGSAAPKGLADMLGMGQNNLFGIQGLSTPQAIGGALGLGQLLLGWNQWSGLKGMMEDQLDLQKDRWAQSKQELDRLRNTRNRLNSQYSGTTAPLSTTLAGGSRYAPQGYNGQGVQ